MTDIEFLTNQANKVEGLAYAGFETFRGSPYTSCARETGQNSRDAALGGIPVRVSFRLHEIPRADVPFADHLQHSIDCCLKDPQDQKTQQHLRRARDAVSAPAIKVLEIADINTTGLTGPVSEPHSIFAALVKGDGVTSKSHADSAGSYGIGKNAAYAVSDLQTVVYSSCWLDDLTNTLSFACQGRLRLISHVDGADRYSAEGYWGLPGFNAIEDVEAVPEWLRRNTRGTSIFSVGFREQEHWADRMTLSLVTNFFLAIDRREIEFEIGGNQTLINQSTLDSTLADKDLERAAEQTDQEEALERARRLLTCVRSDASAKHTISVAGLGDFTLHLLVAEGLPREVHVLRNGIYITNNFAKFGQPMKQFPRTREFIAVLEPARTVEGRRPSELLKQLENPAHDTFEPERIVDPVELQVARQQIKTLITRVRAIIRSAAQMDDIDQSYLQELAHLFASDGASNTGDEADERNPERFRFGEARRGRRSPPSGVTDTGKGLRRGSKKKRGPSVRTGQGKRTRTPAGSQAAVPLEAVRSFLRPDANDGRWRTIWFTPATTSDIDIAVAASGLTSDAPLRIASTSAGAIVGGRIRTAVVAGERAEIELSFSEAFSGPIELSAVAVPAPAEGA